MSTFGLGDHHFLVISGFNASKSLTINILSARGNSRSDGTPRKSGTTRMITKTTIIRSCFLFTREEKTPNLL